MVVKNSVDVLLLISYKSKWSETPRFLDGGVSLVRGTWAFGP